MLEIEKQLSEWRNSRNIKTFPLTIKEDLLGELEEVKKEGKSTAEILK